MSAPHPRTARPGAGLRILRAAVFAAVCVVLSGAGHAIASCATVPLWTLGAGFLGVLAVAVPLAGRARSLPGIAALLAVGQTVLHTLFGLGQHGTAATDAAHSDATLVAQAARLVCGTTAAALSPAQAQRILVEARLYQPEQGGHAGQHPDAMSATADPSAALLPSLPMLLVHVLAAVVAGWLLRRGDLALLRIAELSAHSVAEGAPVRSLRAAFALARALRAGLLGTPDARPRFRCAPARAVPEPRTTALQHTVIRRGPPAAVLVLAA
ncbi:hypothetical protein SSP24_51690 [Streptomyces spinoverrucosus]|uniref:Integral membrane protein n=1 Tax=Streptomyces spinoverrucosus TaxID=284043 RepID=A0A4Y3VKQ2_9ACTN|nr:hypothetical protein [Streptomyces spinoverrucosus]GEC07514.1 hypothetical protein SSP24_51690 [Streptomyces spinoverrucosus]GHB63760.1 hypothetical protein GCM10010397_37300 [Streptomyces spinoverrucosus]